MIIIRRRTPERARANPPDQPATLSRPRSPHPTPTTLSCRAVSTRGNPIPQRREKSPTAQAPCLPPPCSCVTRTTPAEYPSVQTGSRRASRSRTAYPVSGGRNPRCPPSEPRNLCAAPRRKSPGLHARALCPTPPAWSSPTPRAQTSLLQRANVCREPLCTPLSAHLQPEPFHPVVASASTRSQRAVDSRNA